MNPLARTIAKAERGRFGRHLVVLTLAFLLARSPLAQAQRLAVAEGGRSAAILASAEAEGATFYARRGREATPRCTEGHEVGPAESGDFTIGGMLGGGKALRAGRIGKIWWRPAHASATMPPLTVRGRNLSTLRDTVSFSTATVAWPQPTFPLPIPPVNSREYFFPSGFSVPTAGRWLVIATSGDNWGCFILTAV